MWENEDDQVTDEETEEEKEPTDVRREFNPMITWFYMCVAIAAVYGVGFIGGFPLMILVSVFLMIWMIREASYILRVLVGNFPRAAAVVNVIHAGVWFGLFLINVYTLEQFGAPILWPEIENLTMMAPLFISTGVFGTTNIRLMYGPPGSK